MITEKTEWVPAAPAQLTLTDRDLHLWRIPLTDQLTTKYLSMLDAAEKARAERFYFDKDREHFILSHGVMREMLSGYLQCNPRAIEYAFNEHRKPFIKNTVLQFNLSHSHDMAVLAVTKNTEVGVDIEYQQRDRSTLDIAKRFYSPLEYKNLIALPEAQQTQAFFNIWSRKEAFIKALGRGLSYPLDQFSVSCKEEAALLELQEAPAQIPQWQLNSFHIAPDYAGAWALRKEKCLVTHCLTAHRNQ